MTKVEVVDDGTPLHYAENNLGQCWNCKRCVDQHPAKLVKPTVLSGREVDIFLPVCSLSGGVIRTSVYYKTCPYREEGEQDG